MAITYLSGGRVQGNYVAGDTGTSQSYRMNGAVGDFVGTNITDGSLTWTAPTGDRGGYTSSYASDILTWDLGSALDDDDWVIRFELDFTTWNPNNSAYSMNGYAIWIADNATATNDTSCDWASIMGYLAQGSSFVNHIGNRMRTSAKPETGFSNGSADCTLTSISATTYYCEAKRNGTSLTLSMTTNSDYTTSASTNTISGDDATGLRYLKSCAFTEYRSNGDPTGSSAGTVKNLKICNGTGTFSNGAVTYTLADVIKTTDDKATLIDTSKLGTDGNWTTVTALTADTSTATPTNLDTASWDCNGGSSDTTKISLTNAQIFPKDSSFTFSTWIKPSSQQTACLIDDDGGTNSVIVFVQGGGTALEFTVKKDGSTSVGTEANYTFSSGSWYNIVCTFDKDTGTTKSYVNYSTTVQTATNSSVDTCATNTAWKMIGNGSETYGGLMLESAIWDKVLTDNERRDLYYGGSGGSGGSAGAGKKANTIASDNLICYWNGADVSAPITNGGASNKELPAGTRFEEVDTRKIYRRFVGGYDAGIGSDADWTTITDLAMNSTVSSPTGLGTNSLVFNGSTTLLKMDTSGRSSLFPVASDFSMSFWQSQTDQATNGTSQNQPYIMPTDGSGMRWEQAYNAGISGGRVMVDLSDGSNTCSTDANGVAAHGLVDDDWFLWIFTFDASNGTGTLYKGRYGTDSNVSQYRTSGTTSCTGAPDDSMYLMGTLSTESYGNPDEGRMNDICIWNKVLTSSEMHDMFNSGSNSAGGTAKKAPDVNKSAIRAYWDCQTATAPVKNLAAGTKWIEKGVAE